MSMYATPTSNGRLARSSQSPLSPKYSHLGYQESLVQARRKIADNERRKYDEQRARQKEEQVKQRHLQAERLMLQRKREEDANRTGEELGGQLLQSLKAEVMARMEAQLKDDVRQHADRDKQSWYKDFTEFEKAKILDQLQEELEPVIRSELTLSLLGEVREDLKVELTPEVVESLRNEHSQSVEGEVREQLRQNLGASVIEQIRRENLQEVQEQLREENRQQIIGELREQSKAEVIEQLRAEQHDAVLAALRTELASKAIPDQGEIAETTIKEAIPGSASSALPSIDQASSGRLMHDLSANQGSLNGEREETGLNSHDLYPDLTDIVGQDIVGSDASGSQAKGQIGALLAETLEGVNGRALSAEVNNPLLQSPDHLDGAAKQEQIGPTTANQDVDASETDRSFLPDITQYQVEDQGVEADNPDFQTAPEQKDFRFNPDVHELKFSSPASENKAGVKRSLSRSDGELDAPEPPVKRKRRDEDAGGKNEEIQSEEDTRSRGFISGKQVHISEDERSEATDSDGIPDEQGSFDRDLYDSDEYYEEDFSSREDGSAGEGHEEGTSDEAVDARQRQLLQNRHDIRQLLEGFEEDVDAGQDYSTGSASASRSASGDEDGTEYEDEYASDEMEEDAQEPVIKYSNTQETAIELDD